MSKLRQQLIQELVLRNYSPRTQEAYVSAVYQLAKYYRRSPDLLSDQQLKDYLFYLAQTRQLSASSRNQATSALRFFYTHVLGRSVEQLMRVLPRPSQGTRRPEVFSAGELERLFTVRPVPDPNCRRHGFTFPSNDVAGSAAQFNSSVSIVPPRHMTQPASAFWRRHDGYTARS